MRELIEDLQLLISDSFTDSEIAAIDQALDLSGLTSIEELLQLAPEDLANLDLTEGLLSRLAQKVSHKLSAAKAKYHGKHAERYGLHTAKGKDHYDLGYRANRKVGAAEVKQRAERRADARAQVASKHLERTHFNKKMDSKHGSDWRTKIRVTAEKHGVQAPHRDLMKKINAVHGSHEARPREEPNHMPDRSSSKTEKLLRVPKPRHGAAHGKGFWTNKANYEPRTAYHAQKTIIQRGPSLKG